MNSTLQRRELDKAGNLVLADFIGMSAEQAGEKMGAEFTLVPHEEIDNVVNLIPCELSRLCGLMSDQPGTDQVRIQMRSSMGSHWIKWSRTSSFPRAVALFVRTNMLVQSTN